MRVIAMFCVVLACILPRSAAAQEELVRINMNNADIRTVIQWIAEQTQKNFIIDPRVKGKLSVLSSQPMTMDQAYQVFLTALDVYGFAVVESGSNVKIIPNAQARAAGLPIVETFTSADKDSADLVIHVIKVKNITANEIVTLLRPLVPQTGHLGAFPSSNSIIIADRANNINRLSDLIKQIDNSGSLEIEVIALQHATAKEIIDVVKPLMSKQGKNPALAIEFASDDRSNSILMAGNAERRTDVRALIKSLDRPLRGTGNTKVVYLNYIEATEIKGILDGMTGSIIDEQKSAAVTADNISIEVSETTNALVITAPPSLFETIEQVIAKLDIRRSQVLIDAVIVEVSDTFTRDLEILWATESVSDGDLKAAVSSANLASSTTTAALGGESQSSAFLQSGLTWGFFRNGTLRLLMRAIETDSSSNVLSRPSIITLDNEEAEVLVGSNVPFVTGSQVSASSTVSNPFQTIQREDIGITLKITPKISKAKTITLEIEQEVESVREESVSGAQDLVTDKRSIKTQVLIGNEEILVLGGLLEDRVTQSESKVPLLGDIPLLGRLFRGSSETTRKQNLMVFIKPTILDESGKIYDTTKERYDSIREKQQQDDSGKPLDLPPYQDLEDGEIYDLGAPRAGQRDSLPSSAAP
ncbi:MAG: type II secretion system secretin GspD [Gammaproteobacteria bacterium]|nr:type II secretion system secretin GspD [Gammaproteobacteria bacterium]MBT8152007.1 type II secretion system secretin GspD [Gammaproteobacteria bacterium]NND39113.1 type II secretion system secretin GspD [Pseudomonadales bacterium]NNL11339.1 type II secretion system secretin GspD [Pseudomonadales bacterium]NNM11741.1 type II secretion system secretin GspD [Pseudomonadales bacterium]